MRHIVVPSAIIFPFNEMLTNAFRENTSFVNFMKKNTQILTSLLCWEGVRNIRVDMIILAKTKQTSKKTYFGLLLSLHSTMCIDICFGPCVFVCF